jgi:hypothetical protein
MQRNHRINGVVRAGCLLVLALALPGCHGDTAQGGGTDTGHAARQGTPQQVQQPVPTPPTADQIDPDSPRAVLNGTSTTEPQAGEPSAKRGARH